jgi:hypothetical protein
MTAVRLRSLSAVLLAMVCTLVVGMSSMLTPAFVSGVEKVIAQLKLLADEGFIMGGTGNPLPTASYISAVENLYLQPSPPLFPGQPTFPGYTFEGLTTPEQFCPFTACPPGGLTFGQSLAQGEADLNNAIVPELQDGNNVAVFGYSQSAVIASQVMNNLINNPPPGLTSSDLSNLHVVLIGDPNNPIGGILDRFQFPDGIQAFSLAPAPQHVPFFDIPLNLPPTPTVPIPTTVYTGEYDGYADFPLDPSNILADINALIGIETVHPYYPDPAPGVNLDINHIIDLGAIGDAHFYDIPAPLPVLAFMYDGGPAGRFFYDAFDPWMSLINNFAYGNPGDPDAGITVDGVDPIGYAGPWQIDATGQLVASGVAGFLPKMDPLQMLAGAEYATVQTFVGPIDDLLHDAGQSPIPQSVVDGLLSGYNFTNDVDQFLLTGWEQLTAGIPFLGPDAIFDGSPLISGQPLIDLLGGVFDVFNFFGA